MTDQNKTKKQLISEMAVLRRRVRGLAKSEIEGKRMQRLLHRQSLEINERKSKLNCVFDFSKIIHNPDTSVPEIAEKLVDLIPAGWQRPACARVTLEERTFQTVNFAESRWKLISDITKGSERIGTVEVFFLGKTSSDPFLPEDQVLLDDLTKRFGRVIRRKHSEETLREKEAYYREVFEKSNYGMAVTDMDGHFSDCNRAFLDLLGYTSLDDLQALSYDSITPPEYREEEKKLIVKQTGEHGYSEGYEKELIRRSGERIPVVIKVWLRRDMNRLPVGMYIIARDMIKRKISQESLRKREQELADKSVHLEEVNTALRVLLEHREKDKSDLEEKILANVKRLIIPYLEKLKKSRIGTRDAAYLQIIETNLNNIISPFLSRLTLKYSHLSSRETQVAHLVKEGKITKEISELLGVSPKAIDLYRGGIRRKLGLKNRKINLKSYLSSLI